MSLQTDIMTALAGIGADKVWPEAVPEDIDTPFVVYRIMSQDPEVTLDDSLDLNRYAVAFECYADDYQGALTLAGQVATAMSASTLVQYKDTSPGDDYIPLLDGYMAPLFFGIWHD